MLPRLSLRSHCPPGRICDLVFVCELLIPTTLGTYLGSLASGCLSLFPPLWLHPAPLHILLGYLNAGVILLYSCPA
ncbi:hypothetical protein BDV41DRAFT_110537 [Aspergillus transmontanensis]|uniref:Uncharacterized protein n=1 Tax=Aspergillus transmontanensis TaxID=1034304 RepID=A0A5N6VDW4_9EURO|nr:hypothetical protein BDV41DRAFT_110537 [Aspergillus transmontanensis]